MHFAHFEKRCLKTENSAEQGNGEFRIHMQFSFSKSNVGIQIGAPTIECLTVS